MPKFIKLTVKGRPLAIHVNIEHISTIVPGGSEDGEGTTLVLIGKGVVEVSESGIEVFNKLAEIEKS